jgi:hypothetical protein
MKKDSLTQEKLKHLSSFITPVSDITTAVKSIPEKYLLEPNRCFYTGITQYPFCCTG